MSRKPIDTGDDNVIIKYKQTQQTLKDYKALAQLHPNEFWAVYLTSACNIGIALADTRVWKHGGVEVDDDTKMDVDIEHAGESEQNQSDIDDMADAEQQEFLEAGGVVVDDEPELYPHAHSEPNGAMPIEEPVAPVNEPVAAEQPPKRRRIMFDDDPVKAPG